MSISVVFNNTTLSYNILMSSFEEDNNLQIDYWQVIRNHWGIILLTLILSVVTAFVITTLMSPKYKAFTKFAVFPDLTTINSSNTKDIFKSDYNRAFIQGQIDVMKSPEVLELLDGGRVDGKPVREYTSNMGDNYDVALQRLANRLKIWQDVESPDAVFVEVVDLSNTQAKEMANKLREVFYQYRIKKRSGQRENTTEQLGGDLELAKDLLDKKYEELTASAKRLNLPFTPDSLSRHNNEVKAEYDRKNAELLDSKDEIKKFEITAEIVVGKSDEELMAYLSTDRAIISRAGVIATHEEIKYLKQQRRLYKDNDGIGAKHPKMKSNSEETQIKEEELRKMLEDVRQSVVETLDTRKKELASLEQSIANLEEDYAEYNSNFIVHERLLAEHQELDEDVKGIRTDTKDAGKSERYLNEPIKLLIPAILPTKQYSPDVQLIMIVGAVAGLILGLGIAFLLELLDTSVKTMEDVEKYLQVPVLAVIPQDVGLLVDSKGPSPDAEAYRILRTNIEFKRKDASENAITVVSGGAGEGKSTTILNLAYICAQGGYSTLIIDGDLRRPRLHTYLGLTSRVGLSNYLTTDAPLEAVVVKTQVENLYFMPSGVLPTDAADILNSKRMTEMISTVKSRFDMVLIDSPPILGVSDASVISSEVDHTIMVVQHRKLPRKMLQRVRQSVENVGGNVIGVVLNNVDIRSDTEYQYYTSYYTYYSPAAMKEAAKLAETQSTDKKVAQNTGDDLY